VHPLKQVLTFVLMLVFRHQIDPIMVVVMQWMNPDFKVQPFMHGLVPVHQLVWLLKMIVEIGDVRHWMHGDVVVQALMNVLVLKLPIVWLPKLFTTRMVFAQRRYPNWITQPLMHPLSWWRCAWCYRSRGTLTWWRW